MYIPCYLFLKPLQFFKFFFPRRIFQVFCRHIPIQRNRRFDISAHENGPHVSSHVNGSNTDMSSRWDISCHRYWVCLAREYKIMPLFEIGWDEIHIYNLYNYSVYNILRKLNKTVVFGGWYGNMVLIQEKVTEVFTAFLIVRSYYHFCPIISTY